MTDPQPMNDDQPLDETGEPVSQARVYRGLAASAALLIAIGTVVFHWLEEWSWVDAFYFSVVAATTVGFGDLSPTSDGSKLFTVAYIVVGIGLIAAFLDARFKRAASRHIWHGHG
jgi:hypothetical protein